MSDIEPRNILEKIFLSIANILDGPVTWVRSKYVEPNQKESQWYHQKFPRVPSIEECDTDDVVCQFEAEFQYKRDRKVDTEIVSILRERFENCVLYESPDHLEKCECVLKTYEEASTNWFIKYGDLGAYDTARAALMKQKHRMLWERRNGPVGCGIREQTS